MGQLAEKEVDGPLKRDQYGDSVSANGSPERRKLMMERLCVGEAFVNPIQRSAFSWPIRSLEVTMKNVAGPVDLDGDVLTGNHRVHGSR